MVDRNSGFCLIVALCACLTWFILLPNNLAWAQEKVNPSTPITFIINFPPGSSADLPLRVVHAALQNALEFFKQVFGLDIVPVHFTGTGPAKNAIMGGHVHLASTGLGVFVPLIKSKQVTFLVTGAPKRLLDFPDVPTLKDKGFPKAALNVWSGVFGHAKTLRM